MNFQKINADYFVKKFDCPQLASKIEEWLEGINTRHTVCDNAQLNEYIMFVLKTMATPRASRTPQQNLSVWEEGWSQHLTALNKKRILLADLKPKYFRPTKFFRFNKKVVCVENENIEYELFTVARKVIFQKYLPGYNDIYELGCGSCHNLLMLAKMFPKSTLHGFDWTKTSNAIADGLCKFLPNKISGKRFNMANVPGKKMIKPDSAVFTIHAMEQLGERFEELTRYLIECRPSIVVNYEPIVEMYDQNDLTDYLAYFYSIKRNYLSGYWPFLENLAAAGKIEIIKAVRPYIGGVIHEASLIVWRPC